MSKKRASVKGRGSEIFFGELDTMSLAAEPQLDDRTLNGQAMEDAFYAEMIDDHVPDLEPGDRGGGVTGVASTFRPPSGGAGR